jgi:fused signal recognition particle receptor
VLSIRHELGVPVRYIGTGEKAEDLEPFDAREFARRLFEE